MVTVIRHKTLHAWVMTLLRVLTSSSYYYYYYYYYY